LGEGILAVCRGLPQVWRNNESAQWNHLEELFQTICDIELEEHSGKRNRLTSNDVKLDEFLKREIHEGGADVPTPPSAL